MFLERPWSHAPRQGCGRPIRLASLDVSVLQDQLLAPMLKIADVRTDKRIDFVGGIRGTRELERLVQSGKAAVAFSLYPGERVGPDVRVRRRRDHAAQVDVVRTEAQGWIADSRDLNLERGILNRQLEDRS